MPSVAQETPSSQSCKKRRRDDQDEGRGHTDIQPSLYAGDFSKPTGLLAADYLARRPFHQNVSNNINTEETFDHGPLFHQLPLSMRITMPMKRQRTYEKDEEATRPESISSHTFQKRQSRSPTTGINRLGMNRCHICSRKPTKKNELDQYADCQGCGQRACFVCMRECLGWLQPHLQDDIPSLSGPISDASTGSFKMQDCDTEEVANNARENDEDAHHGQQLGQDHQPQSSPGWVGVGHRQMICSRCCVERSQDGEVVCLGCLHFVEG